MSKTIELVINRTYHKLWVYYSRRRINR